ncbi:MAG: RHS repeat-associated core domain-containing protein, partial [Telluria sp.]
MALLRSSFFSRTFRAFLPILLATSMGTARAQESTAIQEQFKDIRAPNAIAAIGPNLFGDTVNLYNGSLEFRQIDVALPGNNALPVSVGRRIAAGELRLGMQPFGKWEMDIPHLSGTFANNVGWRGEDGTTKRCSSFGAPPTAVGMQGSSVWDPYEFWHGNFMYIPGEGTQQLLSRSPENQVAPGAVATYPVVTSRFWSLSCLPTIKNGSTLGEGFLAVSPDGTSYYFDWLVNYPAQLLQKSSDGPTMKVASKTATAPDEELDTKQKDKSAPPSPTAVATATLARTEVWLLPSKVVDRFGNTVTYTYDPAKPKNLMRIDSSDGRLITLTYNAADQVATVNDQSRIWNYSYHTIGTKANLDKVVQPDGSSWDFANFDAILDPVNLINSGGCNSPPPINSGPGTGSIIHPSGATGTFTVTPTIHGRSHLEHSCTYTSTTEYLLTPRFFATRSLTKKAITGPGLPSMVWNYDYGPTNESWVECTSCISTKTVTVTDPATNVSRYTYGNQHNVNEGRLELSETGWNGSSALSSTAHYYKPFGAGPYPHYMGYANTGNFGDADMNARLAPEYQRVVTQQGATFTWTADVFDTKARPTTVRRYSSLNTGRTEYSEYEGGIAKWVMGPLKKLTEGSGKVMVLNTYNLTTGNLEEVSQFGKSQGTFTYNADGTVAARRDGKNQATSYTDYFRGIPRLVTFADATTEAYGVHNIGKITSKRDQKGSTTFFGIDSMGRIGSVTPASDPGITWNGTTIAYAWVPYAEWNLPAGHWRQTITTGAGVETNLLDALMRVYYSTKADSNNAASTSKFTHTQYDFNGRPAFTAYPRRSYAEINGGVRNEYDALGRPAAIRKDSELGVISETFAYGSNFTTTATNGRGTSTTSSFHAYDQPTSAIASIVAPEGVSVTIARDVFGKPTSVTRSGGGKSISRTYVYDAVERLCKTIEPEVNATAQEYDAANNVLWRGSGISLPGTVCDSGSVPFAKRVSFGYDVLNRLTSTTYGDGSPGITRTYHLDSAPKTVTSNGTNWSYSYFNRGLPKEETLTYGGVNYTLSRSYDANGSLSTLAYPDASTVSYTPNALGEATQVGGYASAITYHPNGAINSFSYGNGIAHTLTQHVRGLPKRSSDAGIVLDEYAFDQNANVASIVDYQEGVNSRTMSYDGLDRLKQVDAPWVWTNAYFGYDALDNLISSNFTGGPGIARAMVHNYDGGNRLMSMTGTAGFAVNSAYDSQGNITQRGPQSFVFDQGNRITAATGKATYIYDGLGRRASTVTPDGVNRLQMYSQDGRLMFAGPTNLTKTKYIYIHNHVLAEVNGASIEYIHTDGLGSPIARTNTGAVLLDRTRYEPYGRTAAGAPSTIGFTGHVNDIDTGLTYMQQRYYDPVAGRFLSIDPVTTDSNTGGSFN